MSSANAVADGSSASPGGGASNTPRFIEIAANLLDEQYQGRYNEGKQYHPPDMNEVLKRAWDAGVERIIITAGNLKESRLALELARSDPRLYSTVGVHPTRCNEFDEYEEGGSEAYMDALETVLIEGQKEGKVVAVGECGLDYDRLQFCDKTTQKKWFEAQFSLAKKSGLPMFLHLRAAEPDFMDIIRRHEDDFDGGVVHSFDGSLEELGRVLEMQKLEIGINGCSLKKPDNILVAALVPNDRLHFETDCPWCDIRPSHAGSTAIQKAPMKNIPAKDRKKHSPDCLVKSRNEPCNIYAVAEVVASAKLALSQGKINSSVCSEDGSLETMKLQPPSDEQLNELAHQVYNNSLRMFFKSSA